MSVLCSVFPLLSAAFFKLSFIHMFLFPLSLLLSSPLAVPLFSSPRHPSPISTVQALHVAVGRHPEVGQLDDANLPCYVVPRAMAARVCAVGSAGVVSCPQHVGFSL